MNELEKKIIRLEAENRELKKHNDNMFDALKQAAILMNEDKINFRRVRKAKKIIKQSVLERLVIYD